jgi:hypothetical protein
MTTHPRVMCQRNLWAALEPCDTRYLSFGSAPDVPSKHNRRGRRDAAMRVVGTFRLGGECHGGRLWKHCAANKGEEIWGLAVFRRFVGVTSPVGAPLSLWIRMSDLRSRGRSSSIRDQKQHCSLFTIGDRVGMSVLRAVVMSVLVQDAENSPPPIKKRIFQTERVH